MKFFSKIITDPKLIKGSAHFRQQRKDKRDSERRRNTKIRAEVAQQGQTGTSRSRGHW